ncbi:MAG: 3D domain-containing protein, partial [Bacilli bacterium]
MFNTCKKLSLFFVVIITLIGILVADANINYCYAPTLPYQEPLPIEEENIETEAFIFLATAYTLNECDGDGYTATMTIPIEGRTVAVDPSVIPYGTRLIINGRSGYIAEDCGGAIKNNRIDIFMNDYQEAINFGKQYVIV